MTKRYSDLLGLHTIEDRFEYLKIRGSVGRSTFGFDRYLNQRFYTGSEWRNLRKHIIARDLGCDLGIEGYEIHSKLLIHHMNPIQTDDFRQDRQDMLDPEYLITTTHQTHNAIHYGDAKQLKQPFTERTRGDTALW